MPPGKGNDSFPLMACIVADQDNSDVEPLYNHKQFCLFLLIGKEVRTRSLQYHSTLTLDRSARRQVPSDSEYAPSEFTNEQEQGLSGDYSSDRVSRLMSGGTDDIAANVEQASSRLRSYHRNRHGNESSRNSSDDGILDGVQSNADRDLHPQPLRGAEYGYGRDGAEQQHADFVPFLAHPDNIGGAGYHPIHHQTFPVHDPNEYVNQGHHQYGIPVTGVFPAPPAPDYGRLHDWYRFWDEVSHRPLSPESDGHPDEHSAVHSVAINVDGQTYATGEYQQGVHDEAVEPVRGGETEASRDFPNSPPFRYYPYGTSRGRPLSIRKDDRGQKSWCRKKANTGHPTKEKSSRP
jgi:hypothetical protein